MNRLFILFTAIIIVVLGIYIQVYSLPNTFLSGSNVSNKNINQLSSTVKNIAKKPLQIQIKDRVYQYRFSDLGISINTESTVKAMMQPNQNFPSNYLAFFKSIWSPRIIIPVVTFSEDFSIFTAETIFDFSQKKDQIVIDETNKTISYLENEEKYRIDPSSLKSQILFGLGKETPLQPELIKITNNNKQQVLSINRQLELIFLKPVYIVVKDQNTDKNLTLSIPELKKIVSIDINPQLQELKTNINDQILFEFFNKNLIQSNDKKISYDSLKKDFVSLISSRANGVEINTIVTKIDVNPNTTGNLAKKYIEIDISQQMMYLFEDNSLAARHRVSTGLYYPTPVGQFKILNKAVNAYSDIYHVYMPYWMAFGYSSELNAYFGIHELPYWLTSGGYRVQRPREFIGSPHTGGCVALDVGSSLEVYNFSEVGMPVYIFN